MNTTHTPEDRKNVFLELLEAVAVELKREFDTSGIPANLNGVGYESIVYSKMVACAEGTVFEGSVVQTGLHAFPDIVVGGEFGVEVKMTTGDKWTSTGNSVLETTRVPDVHTVYLFFGKFGGTYEARYRAYEECLSDIGVTHSPRYKIDMTLGESDSIFKKMNISYNAFRTQSDSIAILKSYYRTQLKEGEELWWIDSTAEDTSVSPIIRTFSSLSPEEREAYVTEVLVLFPEIYSSSRVKFERAAAYLITEYNAVCSNLRDVFTAGGRVAIQSPSNEILVPKILHHVFTRASAVNATLTSLPPETLAYYWRTEAGSDPVATWKHLVPKGVREVFDLST